VTNPLATCSNGRTTTRRQGDCWMLELISELTPSLTHSTPSRSHRSLAKVSINSRGASCASRSSSGLLSRGKIASYLGDRIAHPRPLDLHGQAECPIEMGEQVGRQRQLAIGPRIAVLRGMATTFAEQRRVILENRGEPGLQQFDPDECDAKLAMIMRVDPE
jgi:hypothetical protein